MVGASLGGTVILPALLRNRGALAARARSLSSDGAGTLARYARRLETIDLRFW